jgi:hypothetical protein
MICATLGIDRGKSANKVIPRTLRIADQRKHNEHRVPGISAARRAVVAHSNVKMILGIKHSSAADNSASDLEAEEGHRHGTKLTKDLARLAGARVVTEIVLASAVHVPSARHNPCSRNLFLKKLDAGKRRYIVAAALQNRRRNLQKSDLDQLYGLTRLGKKPTIKSHGIGGIAVFDVGSVLLGKSPLVFRNSRKIGCRAIYSDGDSAETVGSQEANQGSRRMLGAGIDSNADKRCLTRSHRACQKAKSHSVITIRPPIGAKNEFSHFIPSPKSLFSSLFYHTSRFFVNIFVLLRMRNYFTSLLILPTKYDKIITIKF